MFKFYLKIALKKILKSPLLSLISLLGLTLVMLSITFIGLWLRDELSYDKQIPNCDRLYRFTVAVNNPAANNQSHFARPYQQWATYLKDNFPQIEDMVRISKNESYNIKVGTNVFQCGLYQADKSFIKIFGVNLLAGTKESALSTPLSVIISKSYSEKLFGKVNPLGKTLEVYCRNCTDHKYYTITGVMANMPQSSHFKADFIASLDKPEEPMGWAYYYLLLKKDTKPNEIIEGLPAYIKKVAGDEEAKISSCYLQKVTEIHLKSQKDREFEMNGNITNVYVFITIALFILLIAFINFFNLRLVSAIKGKRTINLMKTFGGKTSDIFYFCMVELLILSLLSCNFALLLAEIFIEEFNQFAGKDIHLGHPATFLFVSCVCIIIVIIAIFLGILAEIIADKTSQSQTSLHLQVISGNYRNGFRLTLSKSLIIAQFSAAIILIISSIGMNKQMTLVFSKRLGNEKDNILCIKNIPVQVVNNYQIFKAELLQNPVVYDVTSSMEDPANQVLDKMPFETSGLQNKKDNNLYVFPVDNNFLSFFEIPLLEGIDFPKYNGNDSISENYILNEAAIHQLGWTPTDAVGKPFNLIFLNNGKNMFKGGKIIGVVRDFQFSSVKNKIQPTVYFQKSFWLFSCIVKIVSSHKKEALRFIEQTWKKNYPDYPFEYSYVEDLYRQLYKNDLQQQLLITLFSMLSIVIACMGLWSISSVIIKNRTKEIGIRKVNGAGAIAIALLLNREFVNLIVIAIVIAIPISYCFLNHWLNQFVVRTELSWWIFALAGLAALIIALTTVSWQAWRAASRNPVEALRYE